MLFLSKFLHRTIYRCMKGKPLLNDGLNQGRLSFFALSFKLFSTYMTSLSVCCSLAMAEESCVYGSSLSTWALLAAAACSSLRCWLDISYCCCCSVHSAQSFEHQHTSLWRSSCICLRVWGFLSGAQHLFYCLWVSG